MFCSLFHKGSNENLGSGKLLRNGTRQGAIAIKPGRTICGILDLKKTWLFYLFIGPEEPVVLDALLPKVFALVPLVKIELHYVLVVALWRKNVICCGSNGWKEKMDGNKISRFHKILSIFDVQYDSVCVVQSFHMVDDEIECTS